MEQNKRKFLEISNVYLPVITYLKEFVALNEESNTLISDWIHIGNKDEKDRLKEIQTKEYPALKAKFENFASTSANADLQSKVSNLLTEFDNTIVLQKKIMQNLETPEQSMNDSLVDASLNLLETQIKPKFQSGQIYLKSILNSEVGFLNKLEHDLNTSYNYMDLMMILILVIILAIGLFASFYATRSITFPLLNLKEVISGLGRGELPQIPISGRDDEIGEMVHALQATIESIKLKTEFAIQTGDGNYTADFEFLGKKDVLGNALIQMRNNLLRTSEEDAGRNWTNEGLARASEILSNDSENSEVFYKKIITFLSEYLNANMGALYLLTNQDSTEGCLEMKATYAFERAQDQKPIYPGAGLAGQAVIQKKTMLLKNLPNDYFKIQSGLGSATPRHLVLIPMVFEEEVKGLIELATMDEFTLLQVEFLEKTAGNLAVAFDLKQRKQKTESLLRESTLLNDQLEHSKEQLTAANTELKTFVYKASHDLKGPLSTMLGLIDLALAEYEGKDDPGYIRMISDTALKLDRILLVLIRIMSIRDSELKTEPIQLEGLTSDVIHSLQNEMASGKVQIFRKNNAIRQISSDKEVMRQILFNILENSIKYSDDSKPNCIIQIDTDDTADGIRIKISDNGVGIMPQLKLRVFEMFFRGNSSSVGSGLGLYFVKNAIQKLGGTVELISETGSGTIVTLYLPATMC